MCPLFEYCPYCRENEMVCCALAILMLVLLVLWLKGFF